MKDVKFVSKKNFEAWASLVGGTISGPNSTSSKIWIDGTLENGVKWRMEVYAMKVVDAQHIYFCSKSWEYNAVKVVTEGYTYCMSATGKGSRDPVNTWAKQQEIYDLLISC